MPWPRICGGKHALLWVLHTNLPADLHMGNWARVRECVYTRRRAVFHSMTSDASRRKSAKANFPSDVKVSLSLSCSFLRYFERFIPSDVYKNDAIGPWRRRKTEVRARSMKGMFMRITVVVTIINGTKSYTNGKICLFSFTAQVDNAGILINFFKVHSHFLYKFPRFMRISHTSPRYSVLNRNFKLRGIIFQSKHTTLLHYDSYSWL